jgi:hypothetical protein
MSVFARSLNISQAKHHVLQSTLYTLWPRAMSTNPLLREQQQAPQLLYSSTTNVAPKKCSAPFFQAPIVKKLEDDLEDLTQSLNDVSISRDPETSTSITSKASRTSLPSSSKAFPSNLAASKKEYRKADSSPFASAAKKVKGKGNKMNRDGRSSKVEPSYESGGIPEPSSEYLAKANTIPESLPVAQHLLVVIDLNGTILYRPHRTRPTHFIARPHALRFLEYCIDTFNVVIWSSAQPVNVHSLVNAIIPPSLRRRLVAIRTRDDFYLTPEDYALRVQCYKRLTRLWQDPVIAQTHPEFALGSRWDQTNTVLVDDSIRKGRSEPYNLIEIPEFFGAENEPGDILPQVHDHLNYLSMHSDVSACLRAFPFKAMSAPYGPSDYAPRSGSGAGPH